tara:strand:+ start:15773 stop:17446 length:1674 start_codon:yes stop_codon:yes gene_type:complete
MSFISTIKNAGRYGELMKVAVKYGFREFVYETKLHLLHSDGKKTLDHDGEGSDASGMSRAARMRLAMEELGPTFIKLGQILSTRPDILPDDWIEEFQKLQSEVPPAPWDKIHAQLVDELGDLDEKFISIEEEPLAAASMGQAHRAVRKDGQSIVLKILRPGIEKTINSDMEILEGIAHWLAKHHDDLPFDPVAVVDEFAGSIKNELDFMHEGRNTDAFREGLEEGEEAWFPIVYWDLTTRRVLALEEIKGVNLSHWKEANLSMEQRERLVRIGAYTVLRQTLEVGFFHADPHPGNLFLMEDGRLCFIDCGMAGRVDEETTRNLAMLIYGTAKSDIDVVFEAFMTLGNVDEDEVDVKQIRRDLQDFMAQYTNVEMSKIDMSGVLRAFTEGLRKHHIQCPSDIVMMIKALTTIEGVGEDLDPDFDLIGFAKPHVEKLVKRQFSLPAIRKRLQKNATTWLKFAENLPGNLTRLSDRLGRNQMGVKMEVEGVDRLNDTVNHASRQLSYSMLIAAMILASAILVLAEQRGGSSFLGWIGGFGFLISFLFALAILFENFIRRR